MVKAREAGDDPRMPPRTDPALAVAIGGRVRAARTTMHMTQETLAARAGLLPATISRVEKGRIVPAFATLGAIAKGLGCELGDLVGSGKVDPTGALILDADERALIERWRRMPTKPRRALTDLMDMALKEVTPSRTKTPVAAVAAATDAPPEDERTC